MNTHVRPWIRLCAPLILVAGLLVATGLALALASPETPATTTEIWTFTTVEDAKLFKNLNARALQFDDEDRPHIAYGGDHLYYAWQDGASWVVTTVDDTPGAGRRAALALDPAGEPVIAYTDGSTALKLARHAGGSWSIETVDEIFPDHAPSLALDSAGHPHIAYSGYWTFTLTYARWDGAAWQIEEVAPAGSRPSLVLDAADQPHIVASWWESGDVTYYTRDGTGWTAETVADTSSYGNALALDSAGHPIVAYVASGGYARVASKVGDVWQSEGLEIASDATDICLALDSADTPYVVFFGGFWTRQADVWTKMGYGGNYPSLALDSAEQVAFASLAATNNMYWINSLRFSRWDGSNWSGETVDWAGMLDGGLDLALDSQGKAQAVYFDIANFAFKHAAETQTGWDVALITTTFMDWSAPPTALALDDAGTPHVSLDGYSGIEYYSLTGDDWAMIPVDGSGWGINDIALDAAGNPMVSYNASGLKLATWTGDDWAIETITDATTLSYHALIADDEGLPHLLLETGYPPNSALRYYRRAGSDWVVSEVVTGLLTTRKSLALDSAGVPHVSFVPSSGLPLAPLDEDVTYYATPSGDGWLTEPITATYDCTNLVVDSADVPHIFCEHWSHVTHGWRVDGAWQFAPVATAPLGSMSLAISGDDRLMLLYYDRRVNDIVLARQLRLTQRLYLPALTMSSP